MNFQNPKTCINPLLAIFPQWTHWDANFLLGQSVRDIILLINWTLFLNLGDFFIASQKTLPQKCVHKLKVRSFKGKVAVLTAHNFKSCDSSTILCLYGRSKISKQHSWRRMALLNTVIVVTKFVAKVWLVDCRNTQFCFLYPFTVHSMDVNLLLNQNHSISESPIAWCWLHQLCKSLFTSAFFTSNY